MKRLIALLVVFVFVCSPVSFSFADDEGKITDGYFEFILNDSKDGLILARYAGDEPSVSVPSSAGDLPVLEIGDNAFYYKMNITEIILPDGLISIGQNAFIMCTSLQRIVIPDSVKSIGIACFLNCSSLTEVKMSLGLESLEDFAFLSCSALEELIFGSELKSVGQSAFQLCTNLKKITLPDPETINIGEGAFLGCPTDMEVIKLLPSEPDNE